MIKITQKDFALIKALQEKEVSTREIQRITDRSKATVGRILRSKTLADYRKLMSNIYEARKLKVADEVESEAEQVGEGKVENQNTEVDSDVETKTKILLNICEAIQLNTEEVRKQRGQLVQMTELLIQIKDKKNGFFR